MDTKDVLVNLLNQLRSRSMTQEEIISLVQGMVPDYPKNPQPGVYYEEYRSSIPGEPTMYMPHCG